MRPWKLLADPGGYIFKWLIGYSALLGPIGGILIADYFVYRRRRLNLAALYDPAGEYRYWRGFSLPGLLALAVSILPNMPGFLKAVDLWPAGCAAPQFLLDLYNYAWFSGFAVAFAAYLLLKKWLPDPSRAAQPAPAA
jgi:NCS1 family nucleobase:cation symporter-1